MKNIKCYIVDDEKDAVERLAVLLSKISNIQIMGMNTNPLKAQHEIKEKQPDLVFTDVEMPYLSGFDLVRQLRNDGLNARFIFVTGFDQYAIKAIKSEAFDYLVKPVDIDELKDSIGRYKESLYKTNSDASGNGNIRDLFSDRELEIIPLLAMGKSSRDIAELLNIAKSTVDTHRKNILFKAGLHKAQELTLFAMQNGLL